MDATSGDTNPWNLLSIVLYKILQCKIRDVIEFENGTIVFISPSSEFSRKMKLKSITGRQKAFLILDQVMATLQSSPTDAGYLNLGVLVDDIIHARRGSLDNAEWLDMADTFSALVFEASSWCRELIPLSKLLEAMAAVKEPFEQLRQGNDPDELEVSVAIGICTAGLFLVAVNKSQRMYQILSSESNKNKMAEMEANLYLKVKAMAQIGAFNSIQYLCTNRSAFPFNLPFAPNPNFQGRADPLAALEKQLSVSRSAIPSDASSKAVAVCVWGVPGVGCTQLALEYVYRHLAEYDGCLWVHGGAIDALTSFLSLQKALHLQERGGGVGAQVDSVMKALGNGRRYAVILDDVATVDILSPLLPKAGACDIIVTSHTALTGLPEIQLEAMELTECIALMHGRIGHKDAKFDHVVGSIGLLQRHPFGLAVAGTHLQNGVDPASLQSILLTVPTKGLWPWEQTKKRTSLDNLLDYTLQTLFRGSQSGDPASDSSAGAVAVGLVEVGAWFGTVSVPLPLLAMALKIFRGWNEIPTEDVIREAANGLLAYRLATLDQLSMGIVFHPLLQRFTKESNRDSHLARSAALAALSAARCCDATVAQFSLFWTSRSEFLTRAEDASHISAVGFQLARFLSLCGRSQEAITVWNELVERRKFPLSPSSLCRAQTLRALTRGSSLGDWGLVQEEIKANVKELPKNLSKTTEAFAIQSALAFASSKLSEPADKSLLDAMSALGLSLVSSVQDRDENGQLKSLAAIDIQGALLARGLRDLAFVVKERNFQEGLLLMRTALAVSERVLPALDGELADALLALGELYEQRSNVVSRQSLLLTAFYSPTPPTAGSPPLGAWAWVEGDVAASVAVEHLGCLLLTQEERKEACQVFESSLALFSNPAKADSVREAHALASLALVMRGPITHDILEKAKFSLEGVVEHLERESRQGLGLSPWQQELLSRSRLKLGLVTFHLQGGSSGLDAARQLIEGSVQGGFGTPSFKRIAQRHVGPSYGSGSGSGLNLDTAAALYEGFLCLGTLMLHAGRVQEAMPVLEKAKAVLDSDVGLSQVDSAHLLALLAAAEWLEGKELSRVLFGLQEAIRVFETEPKQHDNLTFLANLWDCVGRVEEMRAVSGEEDAGFNAALVAFQRAYALREGEEEPARVAMAVSLANVIRVQTAQGLVERVVDSMAQLKMVLEGVLEKELTVSETPPPADAPAGTE